MTYLRLWLARNSGELSRKAIDVLFLALGFSYAFRQKLSYADVPFFPSHVTDYCPALSAISFAHIVIPLVFVAVWKCGADMRDILRVKLESLAATTKREEQHHVS
jgi:hypothetical protein